MDIIIYCHVHQSMCFRFFFKCVDDPNPHPANTGERHNLPWNKTSMKNNIFLLLLDPVKLSQIIITVKTLRLDQSSFIITIAISHCCYRGAIGFDHNHHHYRHHQYHHCDLLTVVIEAIYNSLEAVGLNHVTLLVGLPTNYVFSHRQVLKIQIHSHSLKGSANTLAGPAYANTLALTL